MLLHNVIKEAKTKQKVWLSVTNSKHSGEFHIFLPGGGGLEKEAVEIWLYIKCELLRVQYFINFSI